MATKTTESRSRTRRSAEPSDENGKVAEIPQIVDVDEAPTPRRGRTGVDVSGYNKFIEDGDWHAIESVPDAKKKEAFARQLRRAAARLEMEVATTFAEDEQRLYFRGFAKGEAPARGRRSKATRKNASE